MTAESPLERDEWRRLLGPLAKHRGELAALKDIFDSVVTSAITQLEQTGEIAPSLARPAPPPVMLDDPRFKRLRIHVKQWLVQRRGGPDEGWSEHGQWTIVRDTYRRIDRTFLDEFIVGVRNGEYQPHSRRMIRVPTQAGSDRISELQVVLDDEAGRCLCLQFQTRDKKGVPAPDRIGFALGLMLRTLTKEFEDFQIR